MKLCPKCNKQFSDDANFCPVDAARLHPLEGKETGGGGSDSLTARFELGDKLGGSRTGTVHRAKDKQTGAAVAVKLVSPTVVALPGVAQRLERELKQLERVQSAGVTKVVASGKRSDNQTWIALELLDGAQTLADAITARGPIALDQAAHLIEVIGEALIEAAQVGVVHRDLAPKNVMFAGQDIKLVNFSLPVPTTDKIPGVPEFVAPEQIEGKPVDQRSNLYSLGALYYYVLTGQTVHGGPIEEVHRAHVNGSIKTPSSLAPVPGPVEAVIMRALDRSPTKRFLTVRQFVDEVGRVARGDGSDQRAPQPLGKPGRPKAELVQTLLGVRGGAPLPAAPAPAPAAPAPAPAPQNHSSTVAGVPAGVTLTPKPPVIATPPDLKAPPMSASVAVASSLPNPIAGSAIASAPTAATPQVPPPERSPWAPPATNPPANAPVAANTMAGAGAAVAAAAPELGKLAAAAAPAPPVVAAPVVATPAAASSKPGSSVPPPTVANAPAGKKKPAGEPETKGKFRETMWFKKGDIDARAAEAAATEGKEAPAPEKGDTLPIDERYKDDGTITRGDKEKYSLRTGATQMMKALKEDQGGGTKVSEDALIGEMKGGRQWIMVAIAGGVIALIVIIVLVAL